MARIQFTDFEDAVFTARLTCPDALHPGAHTDNVQLLQLVSEARWRWFAWLGYHETNVEGVQIFVGDQAVQYRAEAFPHQVLDIELAVRDMAAKGFDLVYRMADADSGTLVALGKIGIVCVDRRTRRPCAVPEALCQRLRQLPTLLAEA